ncbi:MAG: response regulator, partial [Thiothrix litoralis]
MRVLIIEDENIIREQVAEDLKKSGFTVDLAADGSQGLYVALEYPIDVAVIDLGLPNSKGGQVNNDLGLDIIRAIRAKGLDYPIIILTARDRWQSKVEGLEAGADDYVTKPFHTEELIARLRVQLRRT